MKNYSSLLYASILFTASNAALANVSCSVTNTSVWANGYQAEITITNTGSNAITDWSVIFDNTFGGTPPTVNNYWNVALTTNAGSTNPMVGKNLNWNGNLAAGASTKFYIIGSYTGNFVSLNCRDQNSVAAPVATFYPDENFQGRGVSLTEGSYSRAALVASGIVDNDIESFTVPAGYVVSLFDKDITSTNNPYTLAVNNIPKAFDFNNRTSSIRFEKLPQNEVPVAGGPRAPVQFKAQVAGSGRVSLNWQRNPTDDIYIIEQLQDGIFKPIQTTPRNQSFATINNLTPNTSYTFRIYARNTKGRSAASTSLAVLTWTEVDTHGWDHFLVPRITFTDEAPGTAGSNLVKAIVPDMPKLIANQTRDISRLIYFTENDRINMLTDLSLSIGDYTFLAGKSGDAPSISIGIDVKYLAKYYAEHGNSNLIFTDEIRGILAHEGTHGYQYRPRNAEPNNEAGSFVEGLADYVRIELGLHPTAFRQKGSAYNGGYSDSGFFIKWLTDTKDPNFARKLNASARDMTNWSWDAACRSILGVGVADLWAEYQLNI